MYDEIVKQATAAFWRGDGCDLTRFLCRCPTESALNGELRITPVQLWRLPGLLVASRHFYRIL